MKDEKRFLVKLINIFLRISASVTKNLLIKLTKSSNHSSSKIEKKVDL